MEKNLTKAAEIFDKLALGGHPFAQVNDCESFCVGNVDLVVQG